MNSPNFQALAVNATADISSFAQGNYMIRNAALLNWWAVWRWWCTEMYGILRELEYVS